MTEKSKIWWEQIPGPSSLISKILENLCEEKSCAFFFTESIPWNSIFYDTIKNTLRKNNSFKETDVIDVSSLDCRNSYDAGKYIAQMYCSSEKLDDYWPGESYAAFLAASDDTVLNSRFVWIRGITKDNLNVWYDFVLDYIRSSVPDKKRAVFFLECKTECKVSVSRHIAVINWKELVHKYDYLIFCSILVSGLKCSDEMKKYISDLAYILSEFNAEFASALLEYGLKLGQTPLNVLDECSEKFISSNGEKVLLENYYSFDYILLEAQIKNIFPAIERFRKKFVTRYYGSISAFLPAVNPLTDEYIKEPYGCELNLLRIMTEKKHLNASEDDIKILKKMHETRNLIAHNKKLDFKTIEEILG